MSKPWHVPLGLEWGTIRPDVPRLPDPPPLPPVDVPKVKKRPGCAGTGDDAVMAAAIDAYRTEGNGRFIKFLAQLEAGKDFRLLNMMRRAAATMKKADVVVSAFVGYVCRTHRSRTGLFPFPQQVFGAKAIDGWMGEYLSRGLSLIDVPVYEATPERRRAYRERIARAQHAELQTTLSVQGSDRGKG